MVRDEVLARIATDAADRVGDFLAGSPGLVEGIASFVESEAESAEERAALALAYVNMTEVLIKAVLAGAVRRTLPALAAQLGVADLVAAFDRVIVDAVEGGVSIEEQAAEILEADNAN